MKNLKLAVKIGFGFGLLIVISAALGGMAIFNMGNVQTDATSLAQEFRSATPPRTSNISRASAPSKLK